MVKSGLQISIVDLFEAKWHRKISDGCSTTTFEEAYKVANGVSHEQFLEYVMTVSNASLPGRNSLFQEDDFQMCRPSQRVAKFGFQAVLYLMFALFWSLYLLVSLTFTEARNNMKEMRIWWWSGGLVGTLCVLGFLLSGVKLFLTALEYVVVIRFPIPFDQFKYKVDTMDTFRVYGITCPLIIAALHFVMVRVWSVLWPESKKDSDLDPPWTGYLFLSRSQFHISVKYRSC